MVRPPLSTTRSHANIVSVLYVIILSAALDLVPPSTPKGIIAFCNIFPALLAKLGWPYLLKGRIRYARRLIGCTTISVGGMLVRLPVLHSLGSWSRATTHRLSHCLIHYICDCWEYALHLSLQVRRERVRQIQLPTACCRSWRVDILAALNSLPPSVCCGASCRVRAMRTPMSPALILPSSRSDTSHQEQEGRVLWAPYFGGSSVGSASV